MCYFTFSYQPVKTTYDLLLFGMILCLYVTVCVILGPLFNKIFSIPYVCFYGIYLLAQNVYHQAFSQYFRLSYALSLSNEVNAFKDSAFELVSFSNIIPYILFLLISIVYIVFYFKYQKGFKTKTIWYIKLASLVVIVPFYLFYSSFNSMLNDDKYQTDFFTLNQTDYYLYDTIYSSNAFVDKYGIITFAYRDVRKSYELDDYSQYKEDVDKYLNNREEPTTNEMTGIFKDKSVIFIQAESYCRYALDKELTPTLYNIYSKGIVVEGFNSPTLVGSTSDTEYLVNLSIIPDSEEYASCYRYIDNKYKTTLASIFNNKGYYTGAYHNCDGNYYNRNLLYPTQLQYNEMTDYSLTNYADQGTDTGYTEELIKVLISKDKFAAYWITYSGHQTYTLDSTGVKQEYIDLVKNKYPNIEDEYVSYLAKNIDLDRSIEILINGFKEKEMLDDVVFVIFGDHKPKGLEIDNNITTDLYIYCSDNELSLKYNKLSTGLDILPTIANMFSLDYDNKTILGHDIFDDSYKGFCFDQDFNFNTLDYKYSYSEGLKDLDGNSIEDSIIQEEANYLSECKRISKIIQKIDYFK